MFCLISEVFWLQKGEQGGAGGRESRSEWSCKKNRTEISGKRQEPDSLINIHFKSLNMGENEATMQDSQKQNKTKKPHSIQYGRLFTICCFQKWWSTT